MNTDSHEKTARPLLRKSDVPLLGGLLSAALLLCAWTLWGGAEGAEAYVYRDGALILTLDLRHDTAITPAECPTLRFVVRDGGVAFETSDCPDQICVHAGFLRRDGQTAVCAPNRVSLRVGRGGSAPDAIAG